MSTAEQDEAANRLSAAAISLEVEDEKLTRLRAGLPLVLTAAVAGEFSQPVTMRGVQTPRDLSAQAAVFAAGCTFEEADIDHVLDVSNAHLSDARFGGIHVSQFFPLPGEFALGAAWRPSDRGIYVDGQSELVITYAQYAAVERVAGWVLVPLGVAALAGLLYRRPRA